MDPTPEPDAVGLRRGQRCSCCGRSRTRHRTPSGRLFIVCVLCDLIPGNVVPEPS